MAFIFYLLLFIASIITGIIIIIVFIRIYKRRSHTELYSEGVRNENNGYYEQALQNYEDALSENRKLKLGGKFGKRISQKIKILRTTIDYEKNFHTIHGA